MNPGIGILAVLFFSTLLAGQQTSEGPDVKLDVPSGAPLRIYLTKRVSKKVGTPVEGKILEPVFAFDREVIPAGSSLTGSVSRTQPVTKWQRVRAILNGDFTPLRSAFLLLRHPHTAQRQPAAAADVGNHGSEFHLCRAFEEKEAAAGRAAGSE